MSAHLARPRAARFPPIIGSPKMTPTVPIMSDHDCQTAGHYQFCLPSPHESASGRAYPASRLHIGYLQPTPSLTATAPLCVQVARFRAALRSGAPPVQARTSARAVDLRPKSEGAVETCHSVPNSCLTPHRYLSQQIIVSESATPSQSYNIRMSASHRPSSLSVETLGCSTPVAPG